jgi:hypothetical protein
MGVNKGLGGVEVNDEDEDELERAALDYLEEEWSDDEGEDRHRINVNEDAEDDSGKGNCFRLFGMFT